MAVQEIESRHHEIHTFECGCMVICEIQLVGLEQTQTTLELCALHGSAGEMFSSLGSMVALVDVGEISNGAKIEVGLAKSILIKAGQ